MSKREIENLIRELQESIKRNDDRQIDINFSRLQDARSDLLREMQFAFNGFEDEDDLFDLPSMSSISDAISKGVDKIRETTSPQTVRRRQEPGRRIENDRWEDWDDDDW